MSDWQPNPPPDKYATWGPEHTFTKEEARGWLADIAAARREARPSPGELNADHEVEGVK
jgi:hypothetical protein